MIMLLMQTLHDPVAFSRIRVRGRFAVLLVLAALLALAAPGQAEADSDEEVRATLVELDLSPPMLYPSTLPSRLIDDKASLSTDRGVVVVWDRGAVSHGDDNRVGYISLTRGPRSFLRGDLQSARSRGYKPRKVRLRGRTVWHLCGHVCGYACMEQNRYYWVYGIYYVGDERGRTVARDQRTILRCMQTLR